MYLFPALLLRCILVHFEGKKLSIVVKDKREEKKEAHPAHYYYAYSMRKEFP